MAVGDVLALVSVALVVWSDVRVLVPTQPLVLVWLVWVSACEVSRGFLVSAFAKYWLALLGSNHLLALLQVQDSVHPLDLARDVQEKVVVCAAGHLLVDAVYGDVVDREDGVDPQDGAVLVVV